MSAHRGRVIYYDNVTENIGGLSALERLVRTVRYKPGWSFAIYAEAGPAKHVQITVEATNSRQLTPLLVTHHFPIPQTLPEYDVERWLFDRILMVEQHEACEFFEVNGERPFYPEHGPGSDPYAIRYRGRAIPPPDGATR